STRAYQVFERTPIECFSSILLRRRLNAVRGQPLNLLSRKTETGLNVAAWKLNYLVDRPEDFCPGSGLLDLRLPWCFSWAFSLSHCAGLSGLSHFTLSATVPEMRGRSQLELKTYGSPRQMAYACTVGSFRLAPRPRLRQSSFSM